MTEIEKLIIMLNKADAEFKVTSINNGIAKQVILYKNGKMIDDAICGSYTHGGREGLLETYKLGDCAGFETAQQVFDGWERMMLEAQ